MSPHCSAIFLQHCRSADVIAAPGNTQAATGSAANISTRTETPSFINSFNITSLSTTDSKTQQAGKGFILPVALGRRSRGQEFAPQDGPDKLAVPLVGKMRSSVRACAPDCYGQQQRSRTFLRGVFHSIRTSGGLTFESAASASSANPGPGFLLDRSLATPCPRCQYIA